MEFKLIKIKQRHMEEWSEAFLSLPRASLAQEAGATVRAAVQASWFASPNTEHKNDQWLIGGVDVGDLEPWQVRQMAEEIDRVYTEARTIPKN